MSFPSPRIIRAETIKLSETVDVLSVLDAHSPLLWWKHNEGFSGLGKLHEIVVRGPDRFAEAQSQWQKLASIAEVTNSVGVTGTGLIALGTFAFSAQSKTDSALVIPEFIVGHTESVSWMTRMSWADDNLSAFSEDEAKHVINSAQSKPALPPLTAHFSSTPKDKDSFTQLVTHAIKHIEAGELDKVVLARMLSSQIDPETDLRPALVTLSERYPECWTFSVDGFFGSSPETLITVEKGSFTARVLAGTAPRGATSQEDIAHAAKLASSSKDLDEHGFATRSVTNALSPLVEQLSVSESPFTLKLANVWHLATDIAGTLHPDVSSLNLIAALHPTAAVAGTPTSAAVDLIHELEKHDRGRYSGPVGWVDAQGDGQWAIGLRCAQKVDSIVSAWAGCGIVADSVAAQELLETSMKFRPIIEALS